MGANGVHFGMPRGLITVAETPLFMRQVGDIWEDAEREAFVNWSVSSLPCSKVNANEDATMGKFGSELIESMKQAADHARGRSMRVTTVEVPDVKAIRRGLRMSQHRFAAAYRIPLPTLKNWEQGRRHPDAPAAAYLLAIKRRPKEVMEAVRV
jgi:putative transcriptional regulator